MSSESLGSRSVRAICIQPRALVLISDHLILAVGPHGRVMRFSSAVFLSVLVKLREVNRQRGMNKPTICVHYTPSDAIAWTLLYLARSLFQHQTARMNTGFLVSDPS